MDKNAKKLKMLLGMPMDMSKQSKNNFKEVKKKTSKKVKKKGSVKC